MGTKKFGAVALWLVCATPAFAGSQDSFAGPQDKEVWITLGTDVLETARTSLRGPGRELPAAAHEKDGVAVVRVRESQLETLAGLVHDKLNRCAGFIAHDTEQEALAAVEASNPSRALQTLVSYTIDNATTANALLSAVQEANIRSTITSLSTKWTSRRHNLQSGIDAANWLKSQWTTLANGRSDVSVSLFTHSASVTPQPSVILTITGTTLPNEVVVLGGHLDSINGSGSSYSAPGADDDASGVASLTEVIRVAMAKGYRPSRTVKFMAYAAEEIGLKGSAAIAAQHKSSGVNVVGVLQLDMTNYRGSSYDIVLVSDYTNAAQNTFLTNLISKYLPGVTSTSTRCGYACSDHASWYNQGYAASIPFEALMGQDNPYIHTANDTLTQTAGSAQNSVKFAKLAAAYVAELAKGTATSSLQPEDASTGR
ncbi:M20/M25/M40 family metallo-hydrolase [Vitiosangium sp. GDMCC 1.1324]|uniref:M20/M25/M40 family metallo-hydrolase n=1 Tax=Vitiosangium sp. (strain GDMCC 1.1324) TaxID=2138576 RepID=UPI000D3D749B|nr:M20/M25/M40 family metallo-hydrolase [Vitiosangium sp. GDMCC 1.1324]PTL85979.1 leucyl aminopeptidase [Vitiosangium sp. GDMCC 1.1324]